MNAYLALFLTIQKYFRILKIVIRLLIHINSHAVKITVDLPTKRNQRHYVFMHSPARYA